MVYVIDEGERDVLAFDSPREADAWCDTSHGEDHRADIAARSAWPTVAAQGPFTLHDLAYAAR